MNLEQTSRALNSQNTSKLVMRSFKNSIVIGRESSLSLKMRVWSELKSLSMNMKTKWTCLIVNLTEQLRQLNLNHHQSWRICKITKSLLRSMKELRKLWTIERSWKCLKSKKRNVLKAWGWRMLRTKENNYWKIKRKRCINLKPKSIPVDIIWKSGWTKTW